MQETSSSIITGTRGRSHRGRALSSLVEAFQHLVWGLCLLNAYLKAENERPEQSETSEFDIEEMESTPWQDSSVGNAERDIFNPLTIEEEDDDQLGGASDGENSDNDQPDGVSDGENSDDDNLGGASDGENLDDDNSGLPDRGGGLGGYIYDVQDTANDKAPTRNIDTGNKAVSIFEEAKTQLSLAKKHIIQLLARENWKELSEYVTVGSGDLVISALEFLARGDTDGYRLEDIYRERCSELRLLVRDTSRRGLLNDLDQVEEEMDSIVYTICQQIQVLDQLSPIYSKRMPKLMAVIDSTKRALEEKLGVYDDLKIRTRAMARQVIRQLEIKQDSNNKAITIFTIVTVLFLPLSFVTSYLGMNTADIRETNSKQGLFWSIAIPLTTVFAGIAMTIAYRQPLKGWVVRHVTKRKFRDRIRDFDY
ncbi:hypothetical protein GGR51DRAFT_437161 [Nemania sp. FL0031]|nr:hypothetical protein GGR51DRAFT_437161 [Nemania sp. FL0031]